MVELLLKGELCKVNGARREGSAAALMAGIIGKQPSLRAQGDESRVGVISTTGQLGSFDELVVF